MLVNDHPSAPDPKRGDNLVLIGPMGAGKSSAARELTRLTGRRWVDTDKLVVRDSGRTIPEIFAAHGEAHFRRLETAALRTLGAERGLVVATGGGIVTRAENAPLLRTLGCIVYLTASPEVLFARVSRNRNRPLLYTDDPRGTLDGLLSERQATYAACADVTVDTSVGTHAQVAERILGGVRLFFTPQEGQRAAP